MKYFKLIVFLILVILTTIYSCQNETKKNITSSAIKDTKIDTHSSAVDLSIFKKEGDAYIVPWPYLMNVKFEEKYDEKMGMEVSYPVFNDTLRLLHGQNVIIEGFYIPVDETGNEKIVILSAYPFAQCFFCGKAGVESIVDILSPTKLPRLKIDSKIKFKGRFKLNRDNFDYLIYVLEEAVLLE